MRQQERQLQKQQYIDILVVYCDLWAEADDEGETFSAESLMHLRLSFSWYETENNEKENCNEVKTTEFLWWKSKTDILIMFTQLEF